ncbi:MAG: hypothetical protein M3340_06220 [Actinomycetota bacterium]|nr:hypothetical protein [Actinomycetota bacterium]
MRVAVLTLALAAGIAAALPGTAAAALLWSQPERLSRNGANGVNTAIDARGDALAVWGERYGPGRGGNAYSWRAPGGEWSARRFVNVDEDGEWTYPRVVMTPLGHATVVWGGADGALLAADARPGQAFGPPVAVTGRMPQTHPELAADDAGNLLVAWPEADRDERTIGWSVRIASRPAGASWTAPRTLTDRAAGTVAIAVNSAGAAAVVWSSADTAEPWIAYRPPAGDFGPPERVPLGAGFAKVALSEAGEAIVSMPGSLLSAPHSNGERFAVRSPLGEWAEPVELDPLGSATQLLAERDGSVSFLVEKPEVASDPREIRYVTRRRDGTIRDSGPIATDAFAASAGTNLRGDVLVAWTQMSGEGEHWEVPTRVGIAQRRAGLFVPEPLLSEPTAQPRRPALNDAQQAVVGWDAASQPGEHPAWVMAAVREDPKLPPLPFPPVVDILPLPDAALDPDGGLRVDARCSLSCKLTPSAMLYASKSTPLASGRGPSRRLRARARRGVEVRFGKDAARSVRKALRQGRRPWVSISLRARGASPRPVTFSRRVRLER